MEAADECWNFAQKCERWAGAEKDSQVRNAFYRMARGFAQLAFQERRASAAGLSSSDVEAELTMLALALAPKQLSVPSSKLSDGRHSVTETTLGDLQKDGEEQLAKPLPDPAKGTR
jgi:hypothetical protein